MKNILNKIITFIVLILFYCLANAQLLVTEAGRLTVPSVDVNGHARQFAFRQPSGLAQDEKGNIYIAEKGGHCILRLDTKGQIQVFAGKRGEKGNIDGRGAKARFDSPSDICWDNKAAALYVTDTENHNIRCIDLDGGVSTIAGAGKMGWNDGMTTEAKFAQPTGIAVHPDGYLVVVDHFSHCIRTVNKDKYGKVSTLAGYPFGAGDREEYKEKALFNRPYDVAISKEGIIFISDEWNHKIKKIDKVGNVVSFAGNGKKGYIDACASKAQFHYPWAITMSPNNVLYVADGYNYTIRTLTDDACVTTVAGQQKQQGYLDGDALSGRINGVTDLLFAKDGSLYLSDIQYSMLRRLYVHKRPAIQLYTIDGRDNYCSSEEVMVVVNTLLEAKKLQTTLWVNNNQIVTKKSFITLDNLKNGWNYVKAVTKHKTHTYRSNELWLYIEPTKKLEVEVRYVLEKDVLEKAKIKTFELCAPDSTKYNWSNGEKSQCITYSLLGSESLWLEIDTPIPCQESYIIIDAAQLNSYLVNNQRKNKKSSKIQNTSIWKTTFTPKNKLRKNKKEDCLSSEMRFMVYHISGKLVHESNHYLPITTIQQVLTSHPRGLYIYQWVKQCPKEKIQISSGKLYN